MRNPRADRTNSQKPKQQSRHTPFPHPSPPCPALVLGKRRAAQFLPRLLLVRTQFFHSPPGVASSSFFRPAFLSLLLAAASKSAPSTTVRRHLYCPLAGCGEVFENHLHNKLDVQTIVPAAGGQFGRAHMMCYTVAPQGGLPCGGLRVADPEPHSFEFAGSRDPGGQK